jgi:hypothetical protein
MMVENEMQLNVMEQATPSLLSDHFNLTVELNQGSASPHTWSEREVLSHMIESIPTLKGFIDDLGLTLG